MASLREKDEKKIEDLLNHLRDYPVDSEGATDEILTDLYTYLMAISPQDGTLHWFCDKATSATREAASFLTRLFAYNSPQSEEWKSRYSQSLSQCCMCAARADYKKHQSKETYVASS